LFKLVPDLVFDDLLGDNDIVYETCTVPGVVQVDSDQVNQRIAREGAKGMVQRVQAESPASLPGKGADQRNTFVAIIKAMMRKDGAGRDSGDVYEALKIVAAAPAFGRDVAASALHKHGKQTGRTFLLARSLLRLGGGQPRPPLDNTLHFCRPSCPGSVRG